MTEWKVTRTWRVWFCNLDVQDVILPDQLVKVLTEREIANQEIATYKKQREAQDQRIQTEKAAGTADMQKELAKQAVGVDIAKNIAEQKKAQADGEASFTRITGEAEGAKRRAIGEGDGAAAKAVGEGKAAGFKAQQEALGQDNTAMVNIINALADGKIKIVPDVMVGGDGGNITGLLSAVLSKMVVPTPKTPAATE